MTDSLFDDHLPKWLRTKSLLHFTPADVALKAATFLNTHSGVRVVDIGSGVGKFCILSALRFPEMNFTGVEVREELFDISNEIRKKHHISNVKFEHNNILNMKLQEFDHLYMFNPFYENLEPENSIDDQFNLNENKFQKTTAYMYNQLLLMPIGTRVAGFHVSEESIPPSFHIIQTSFGDSLLGWEKVE